MILKNVEHYVALAGRHGHFTIGGITMNFSNVSSEWSVMIGLKGISYDEMFCVIVKNVFDI